MKEVIAQVMRKYGLMVTLSAAKRKLRVRV